ncbi:CLUMA_CG004876, isoform A [Clunio marinus]|uniref:CLUMA_CG004876, isoform A n=1 Tax=Clunio marinus TaxID=568069 RepID=A0A1J1HYI7_9DIPT|nr:CLUMA_CG004876, isoform A [Clunio marinus]
METVTSAPLLSDGKELTTKSRNTRRKDGRKLTTKNLKHRNYKLFAEAAKEWNNSCSSIAWEGGSGFEQNYNSSYQSFKLSVHQLKTSLASMSMKVINSSAVKGWERFHNESYKFLPTKPTVIHHKAHKNEFYQEIIVIKKD